MNNIDDKLDPSNQADGDISIFENMKPLPVFYSPQVVFGFTVFLGVMFGSVMMAMNCYRTDQKKGIWQVTAFGVLFTIGEGELFASNPNVNASLAFLLNGGAGVVLNKFFWNLYLGPDTPFQKRPIVAPTIIGIVLAGMIMALLLMKG